MNIKEAIQILENAAAEDIDEIKQIFSSDYKNIRKAIIKYGKTALSDKIEDAKTLNKYVHHSPWFYIGGAAILAGLIGIIIGRSNK